MRREFVPTDCSQGALHVRTGVHEDASALAVQQ